MSDWLSVNLSNRKIIVYGVPWKIIFSIACGYLWKRRNSLTFEDQLILVEERLSTVKSMAIAILNSIVIPSMHGGTFSRREEILEGW